MASRSNQDLVKKNLVLFEEDVPKNNSSRFIKWFTNLADLEKYIYDHIKYDDTFHLHISGLYLNELIKKSIHTIAQVRRINTYYDDNDALQYAQNHFAAESEERKKIEFCLRRNLDKQLENAETAGAVDPSIPRDDMTVHNIAKTKFDRISAKRVCDSGRHSPVPKRFASTNQGYIIGTNSNANFICPSCNILFQEPYQLDCGHRLCKPCLNIEKFCPKCSKCIIKDKAWPDQGCQNDLHGSLTTCSVCGWTGTLKHYQEHNIQNHLGFSNRLIFNEPVAQNNLTQIYARIRSVLHPTYNSNVNCSQIRGAISALLNYIKFLNDNIQQMKRECNDYRNSISVIMSEQLSLLKVLAQEIKDHIRKEEINHNLLKQQLSALKERIEDMQATSSDGTLTWKITDFDEKRRDAESERHKSIYSPPFYSSQTGYKMRLRLFINGDDNARDKHISLFLVIMRGNYDAIIDWPFKFKVTFTLINQSSPEKHYSMSFWSNMMSSSFQRPTTDMNTPYGFSEFFPIGENLNEFVQEDTTFVKAEINFMAQKPAIPMDDGAQELLNDEERVTTVDDNLLSMICGSDTF